MNKNELSDKITEIKKRQSSVEGMEGELKGFFLILKEGNGIKWELNYET